MGWRNSWKSASCCSNAATECFTFSTVIWDHIKFWAQWNLTCELTDENDDIYITHFAANIYPGSVIEKYIRYPQAGSSEKQIISMFSRSSTASSKMAKDKIRIHSPDAQKLVWKTVVTMCQISCTDCRPANRDFETILLTQRQPGSRMRTTRLLFV